MGSSLIGKATFALAAYVSSIFLYGFCELVENSSKIEKQKERESDAANDSIGIN